MQIDPLSLKSFIAARKRDIGALHANGADGFTTCSALTAMMDEAIHSAYASLPAGMKDPIAILGLKGYGRGELSPYSTVDIMVLCPTEEHRGLAGNAAQAMLRFLGDAGLAIGHSVRIVDEAIELQGKAFDEWTSIIESRRCPNPTYLSR